MEENVDVRQRRMDAVTQGSLWGTLGSALVVFGASIIYANDSYIYFTQGKGLFFIITLITGIQIYTFIYVYTLTTFLMEQPKLNSRATIG